MDGNEFSGGNDPENINVLDRGGEYLLKILQRVIFVCDGQVVTYANPFALKTLGAETPDDVIGQPFSKFVDPEFADIIEIGLDAFAEEDEGIPLKMRGFGSRSLDVILVVNGLPSEAGNSKFLIECRDITQFIRASGEARQREERINNILESVADAIVSTDQIGTILSVNTAAVDLFGYAAVEMVGENVSILVPLGERARHDGHMAGYVNAAGKNLNNVPREMKAEHKDRHDFPIEVTLSQFVDDKGEYVFTAVIRDITERKKKEAELHYLAHHDALTGLPNRALFEDRLERTVVQAQRNKNLVGVMFIDLDRFKPINDELGHEAGDIVLKNVATRLGECVRASDTVARVGGDEFIIILSKMEKPQNAATIAGKIIKSLTQPVTVGVEIECTVGASIGISLFPHDADTPEGLVKCGDDAMYKVKETGRNNYKFFNEPP